MTTNLQRLQTQAVVLYRVIEKKARRIEADRLRLGKMLMRIREVMRKAQGGAHRGKNGGSFCVWLEDVGFNIGTAYSYMAQANGRDTSRDPSRKRVQYWQKFAKRMKHSESNAAKVKLLREAIAHLITLHDIRAKVTIR